MTAIRLFVGAVAVVGLAGAAILASPFRIYYNQTPSVATGWYVLDKRQTPALGDLTVVTYEAPDWAKTQNVPVPDGMNLLKFVRAVPGDRLLVEGRKIYRCTFDAQCTQIGERLPDGYKNITFPPLHLPEIVPEGYVYLGSDFEHGWDSRYLGLFPADAMQGVAAPLWTGH